MVNMVVGGVRLAIIVTESAGWEVGCPQVMGNSEQKGYGVPTRATVPRRSWKGSVIGSCPGVTNEHVQAAFLT